ncbi:MAG TPA: SBBP repeat-containing protein, partial [Pirellulales bacterium]|nr:SBBP repeat-containing protein [Pirellulales bacterium]
MRTRRLSKRRNPTADRAKKGHAARFFRPLVEPLESRRLLSVGGGSSALVAGYGQIPMGFEPNVGQTDAQVQFLSRGNGYSLFLTSAEAVLRLQQPGVTRATTAAVSQSPSAVLDLQLVGINRSPQAVGLEKLPGVSNYLIGSDPSGWHADVANYARVEYQSVYPGIDLAYYGNQGRLEYDFNVAAGADPNAIKLKFQGADSIDLDSQGNLVLHTSGGDVVEHAPVVYQEINGAKQSVAGHYVLDGDHQVGFQVGAYDVRKPLVIDPVLVYSTYLGGGKDGSGFGLHDNGSGIAVDASGNAYITGSTSSVKFPVQQFATNGLLQRKFDGIGVPPWYTISGDVAFGTDAYVTKLDPSGQPVYSTYLGGNPDESSLVQVPDPYVGGFDIRGGSFPHNSGVAIAVDTSGNAYVTGDSSFLAPNVLGGEPGFLPLVNPFQATPKPGTQTFVAKLNADGSGLVYSSYLDDPSDTFSSINELATGISVDPAGNAYVTGNHYGSNIEVAFVAKVTADAKLGYYLSFGDPQASVSAQGVAADSSGNVYVVGSSQSATFPTRTFQTAVSGGWDAYVMKLNPNNGTILYSDRLSGSGDDFGEGIAVDAAGDAYVTGVTNSTDFLTTTPTAGGTPLQAAKRGNGTNAFVAKVDPTGSELVYSTYLGGSKTLDPNNVAVSDAGNGIAVDPNGNAYIVGSTNTTDFPKSNPEAHNLLFNGGSSDAFVAEFDSSGTALLQSTYLGGSGTDYGNAIAVDRHGNVLVAGTTGSGDFTTTDNALQRFVGGTIADQTPGTKFAYGSDAFVVKLAGPLTLKALTVQATVGTPFTQPVATFKDPDPKAAPNNFQNVKTSINWGDGTIETGDLIITQTAADPSFSISGNHTYLQPGSYPIVVTLHDNQDNVDVTTNSNVSQRNGNQTEPTIAVDPRDPQHLFAASNDEKGINTAGSTATPGGASGIGGIFAAYSLDGGTTWTPSDATDGLIGDGGDGLPSGARGDPSAVFDKFGNLYLTYLADNGTSVAVVMSTDFGKTFFSVFEFAPPGGADQPKLATGPAGAANSATDPAAIWVTFEGDNPRMIYVAGASVAGPGAAVAFGAALPVPDSAAGLLSSIAVGPAGQVLVAWENTSSKTDGPAAGPTTTPAPAPSLSGKILVNLNPDGLKDANFAVQSTVVVDPGLHGTMVPITPQNSRGIDANPRLAWDTSGGPHNGRVYLSYTGLPLATNPNDTDVELLASDDSGQHWNLYGNNADGTPKAVLVNDDSIPASQFFPSIAIDQKTGDVALAWYDTRNDSNDKKTQFFTAVSADGGSHFSINVPVVVPGAGGTSDATGFAAGSNGFANQYGDYSAIAFYQSFLYPAWADNSSALPGNPNAASTDPSNPTPAGFQLAAARIAVAHVAVPPPQVTAQPIKTSEGGTFLGVVATFTDPVPGLNDSSFTVTINWGDGGAPDTNIAPTGDAINGYVVRASHHFLEEGGYPISVTVTDDVNHLDGSSLTNVNVSRMAGNQIEGTIAINNVSLTSPVNPAQLFTASNLEGIGLLAATSVDGGATWSARTIADGTDGLPVACCDPTAAFDQFGNLFLGYLNADHKNVTVLLSTDGGASFATLTSFNDPGGTDKPSLSTGPNSVWVAYQHDSPSAGISAAGAAITGRGKNNIGSFSAPEAVPDTAAGNFASLAIYNSGQVLLVYQASTADPVHPSAIFAALDTDGLGPGGFAAPVKISDVAVGAKDAIPPQAQRLISPAVSVALDRSGRGNDGRVYVAYADALSAGGKNTNIVVRFSDDQGKTWSDPVLVNDTATNSRFFPSIAVDQSTGDVGVAWYDARNDPNDVKTQFFVAIGTEGGKGFSANLPVSLGMSDATDPKL